jgi:hypothetical protein
MACKRGTNSLVAVVLRKVGKVDFSTRDRVMNVEDSGRSYDRKAINTSRVKVFNPFRCTISRSLAGVDNSLLYRILQGVPEVLT